MVFCKFPLTGMSILLKLGYRIGVDIDTGEMHLASVIEEVVDKANIY